MATQRAHTVLVTGAGSGIGAACARLFAENGHPLLLAGRTEAALTALGDELRTAYGIDVAVLAMDVRDADSACPLLMETARRHGVGVAVINAGVGQYGPVSHTTWKDMRDVLDTNLGGAIMTAKAVLPAVTAAAGSIVFVSSVLGKRAMPFNAAYSASKWGLHGFADALRLECRPHGVHVGVVLPARTDTAFFANMTYSVPQRHRRKVPTAPPETVARAVLSNITGRRRESIVTLPGKLFSLFGYHFPRLSDLLLHFSVPVPETDGNTSTSPATPL